MMETIWALTVTILVTTTADEFSLPGFISSDVSSVSTMYFDSQENCEEGRTRAIEIEEYVLAGTQGIPTYTVSECEMMEVESKVE